MAGLFEIGWAVALNTLMPFPGRDLQSALQLGGIVLLGESADPIRLLSLVLIVAVIAGLKLATPA